jgi:hypothetical protein
MPIRLRSKQKMSDAERELRERELRDRMFELFLKNKDFLFEFENKLIERWIRVTFAATVANGSGLVATILAIKDFKDIIGLPGLVQVASIFSFGLIMGGCSYVTSCFSMTTDVAIATPHLEPEERAKLARPKWIDTFIFVFFHLTFWSSGGAFILANLAIIRFLRAA